MTDKDKASLIVHNARVTTLRGPEAGAFAVRGERFAAVGSEAEVMPAHQKRGVLRAVAAGHQCHQPEQPAHQQVSDL